MEPQDQSLDPELAALLQLLKETPERDPQAVARGRARFLAEVDALHAQAQPQSNRYVRWFPFLRRKVANSSNRNRPRNFAFTFGLAALLLVFVLLSGAGATAYAARSALPGDALYAIKTGIEQTQLRFTADAARQVELHLGFAERRLAEISALITEGRYAGIDQAAREFEYHVQKALEALKDVASGDPMRAQQLTARIAATLSGYARVLSEMLAGVPENVRATMQRALEASERALLFGEEGEVGRDQQNGQINENGDEGSSSSNANEGEDSENMNTSDFGENDNDNANENKNSNANENSNDGASNLNQNRNDNDDDDRENSNQNSNKNENNQNSGNDDDDRGNDHGNKNDDDGGNDNDHKNDNDNDNGNDDDND